MSQEPQGLKTQKNVKCPHCGETYPIKIIINRIGLLIGFPTIDRKGAFTAPKVIPGFQPRTVA